MDHQRLQVDERGYELLDMRNEVPCSSMVEPCSPQERVRYAEILVFIAAADGELVREEIAIIEAMMGRAMLHPESRIKRCRV